jgi:hypothetical protein
MIWRYYINPNPSQIRALKDIEHHPQSCHMTLITNIDLETEKRESEVYIYFPKTTVARSTVPRCSKNTFAHQGFRVYVCSDENN